MSVDDSRPPAQPTDYEQDLIRSLREERRRKLGPEPAASSPPPESAAQPLEAVETPVTASPPIPAPLPVRQPSLVARLSAEGPITANPTPPEQSLPAANPALEIRPPPPSPGIPEQQAQTIEPALAASTRSAPGIEEAVHPAAAAAATEPMPLPEALSARVPPRLAAAPPSGLRWTPIAIGLVVLIIAAGAIAIFRGQPESPADGKKPAAAAPAPPAAFAPPAQAPAARVDQPSVRRDDALEKSFAGHANRQSGRETFRRALMETVAGSGARAVYQQLSGDRVRLRATPTFDGAVVTTLRRGTYVKVKEKPAADNWCQAVLADGREGWMKCQFLEPIAP